ncbi:hypothetical protein [Macrococcus armenti]|uniref:hypothetical protein n=1 Tax=Macrococcus armenti TaxID=2875764 RepID=UPI001CCA1DF1|nr:hypothetical protein [Macrococcus armenti]UBH15041.1 hypothetical protein LAU44_09910 [Macrococcus armenti]UBH17401.1 hypothetical protein LAU39_09935 [Macrococcus armenti]UBH19666.1 hypothetical protein LAU40_09915 [Macrococcus armenti]
MRNRCLLLLLFLIPIPAFANELPPTVLYFEDAQAKPLKYHFNVNDELNYETDDDGYYIFNNTINEIEVDGQKIPIKVGQMYIIHVTEPINENEEHTTNKEPTTEKETTVEKEQHAKENKREPANNSKDVTTVKVLTPSFTPSEPVNVYLNDGKKRVAANKTKDGIVHFRNLDMRKTYTVTTDSTTTPVNIKQGESRLLKLHTNALAPKVRAIRVETKHAPVKQSLAVQLNREKKTDEVKTRNSDTSIRKLTDTDKSKKQNDVESKDKEYTYTKREIISPEKNTQIKQAKPQIPVKPGDFGEVQNTPEQYDQYTTQTKDRNVTQGTSPLQEKLRSDKDKTSENNFNHSINKSSEVSNKQKEINNSELPETGETYNIAFLSILLFAYGSAIIYLSRLIK